MNPLTFDQLLTLITVIAAVVTLILTGFRDSRTNKEGIKAQAAEAKSMSDKLDYISETSKDTRDMVRQMSQQLANHGQQLARIEEELDDHDRRITVVERHIGIGGTD